MGRKEKYTAGQIMSAIQDAEGIMVAAAKNLGCDPKTIRNYRDRYKTVAQAIDDANEDLGDMVESELIKKIKSGDTACIIFFCKTRLKHRGYVERQEISGPGGEPMQLSWVDGETGNSE